MTIAGWSIAQIVQSTVPQNGPGTSGTPSGSCFTARPTFLFTGTYARPGRGAIEESFERNLARLFDRADTPRLSGVQIKAPMHLASDGTLSPSAGKPFTHILKPAGTSGFESLPVIAPADLPDHGAEAAAIAQKMIAIVRKRIGSFE